MNRWDEDGPVYIQLPIVIFGLASIPVICYALYLWSVIWFSAPR